MVSSWPVMMSAVPTAPKLAASMPCNWDVSSCSRKRAAMISKKVKVVPVGKPSCGSKMLACPSTPTGIQIWPRTRHWAPSSLPPGTPHIPSALGPATCPHPAAGVGMQLHPPYGAPQLRDPASTSRWLICSSYFKHLLNLWILFSKCSCKCFS